MRHFGLLSARIAPVIALVAIAATGPSATAQSPGGGIAVVDVAYIFQNDTSIKAQVEGVKAQFKKIDAEMKTRREELTQNAKLLSSFTVGTPKYAEQEEKVAGMESRLRLDMGRKKKEMQDAEAKIYYDNYKLIQQATKMVAEFNKFSIVLRYNSDEIEPENGESILRGVSRNVVYHNSAIDLTKPVMTMMQRIVASREGTTKR